MAPGQGLLQGLRRGVGFRIRDTPAPDHRNVYPTTAMLKLWVSPSRLSQT